MDHKKDTTEHTTQPAHYGTGFTQPPKSYSGLIAVLLAVVILFGGIISALSMMNIRLFRQLSAQTEETATVGFSLCNREAESVAEDAQEVPAGGCRLGLQARSLSSFQRQLYCLPQGMYITQVTAGGAAETQGIVPGDILLKLNGKPVSDPAMLDSALSRYTAGERVTLSIYREGTFLTVHIELESELGGK